MPLKYYKMHIKCTKMAGISAFCGAKAKGVQKGRKRCAKGAQKQRKRGTKAAQKVHLGASWIVLLGKSKSTIPDLNIPGAQCATNPSAGTANPSAGTANPSTGTGT